MNNKLVIKFCRVLWGKNRILPCLNDYIKEEGRHYQLGSKMKKQYQRILSIEARRQNKEKVRFSGNIRVKFLLYEVDSKRDFDNISAVAHKFIFDALQDAEIIDNDKNIVEIYDVLKRNQDVPMIIVEISNVEEKVAAE